MTSESTQASAPDLSHLPYETRVRLLVAAKQGFYWENKGDERFPHWCLRNPSKPVFPAAVIAQGGRCEVAPERLPDYLHDPAAWGPLMERERMSLVTHGGVWRAFETTRAQWGGGTTYFGCATGAHYSADSPGHAVCLAVLAKHGVTINP